MQQLPLGVRLRERATFSNFVVTAAPEAIRRLQTLAISPGGMIWLWGPAGTGKSHLLQAVCAAAPQRVRALYLPLADLALTAVDLLEGADQLDILCLDDVQQSVGSRDFERAVFTAYRGLEERGASLVVSADRPPAALTWALADIGSRLGASEVFQIQYLDENGQCEALRRHATGRGLDLPLETARYLCARLPRDLSHLIEVLEEIDEASLTAQRRLTIPFMREVLGES